MKLILKFVFLLFCYNAQAMTVSCESDKVYFNSADAVFIGTVIEREGIEEDAKKTICWTSERNPKCGSKIATFKVEEVLKGNIRNTIKVAAGDGCYCVSPYLELENRYLVFVTLGDDQESYHSMNSCATQEYNEMRANQLKTD